MRHGISTVSTVSPSTSRATSTISGRTVLPPCRAAKGAEHQRAGLGAGGAAQDFAPVLGPVHRHGFLQQLGNCRRGLDCDHAALAPDPGRAIDRIGAAIGADIDKGSCR
jgi:hypothetical protein